MKPTVLAIDNDQLVLMSLKMMFQDENIEVQTATSGAQGIALFKEDPQQYPVVLLDYEMKVNGIGMNGDEVARELKALRNDVRIIMVSGRENSEIIKACADAGAEQFLIKGPDPTTLVNTIRSILLLEECEEDESEQQRRDKISRTLKMIGRSRELSKVAELVSRFAPFDEPVLILGESGAGKEKIARAVHDNSSRSNKPYMAINCGAIARDMLESELFGHERGSFTGALTKKIGLLEQANGGTVFLDEIGDMPFTLQVKMLRALQEKVIQPVGGVPKKIDFRIVAATHQNLKLAIQQGRFRQDLYFRLNYLKIEVPPLREHPEDIEPLIWHFIWEMQEKTKVTKTISDSAMRKLKGHAWPGNVRDLEATVKKAFAMADARITERIIQEALEEDSADRSLVQLERVKESGEIMPYKDFERIVQDAERALLKRALELAEGIKSAAANMLGMSHSTMNHHRVILGLDKVPIKPIGPTVN